MPKFQSVYIFKFLFILCICFIPKTSIAGDVYDEKIIFDFDGREWVADYANANKEMQLVEYVLKGESVFNWSEMVTIQTFPFKPDEDLLNSINNNYINQYNLGEVIELFKSNTKIIDKIYIHPDKNYPQGEYTLILFMLGSDGVHQVLYAAHDEKQFLNQKQHWVESFKNAKEFNPDESTKNLNSPLLSNSEQMIFIEYRYKTSEAPKNPIYLKSKKLWRATNTYMRTEKHEDVENEKHMQIIVSEPDLWAVNQKTKKGQHHVDPGPTFNTRIPVFGEKKDNGLREFEFGQEQTFFKHYGARQLKDEIIDSHECNVFELTRLYWVLKLYVRKDTNLPYLVSRKGPDNKMMSVYYETYQSNLDFDSTLFTKPEGISWQK